MKAKNYRWWESPPADVHRDVCSTTKTVYDNDEERRLRLERAYRLFTDNTLEGRLGPNYGRSVGARQGALSFNMVRVLVQTAQAKLVQQPPPRPWFVTDGADWQTQQRAKGLSKFTAGTMYRTGFDAKARRVALLSALFGQGGLKFYEHRGEPCVEGVYPWEVLVDERDGYNPDVPPQSLYQVSWIDRDVLKARFPRAPAEVFAPKLAPDEPPAPTYEPMDEGDWLAALDEAGDADLGEDWGHDTTTDQVCVIEAWHLASGPEAGDGRHVICTDACTLLDEAWTDDSFPFVWFQWTDQVCGYWSPGIADEIWALQYELNLTTDRFRKMLHNAAVTRVYIEQTGKVTPNPMTNEAVAIYYYRPGGRPPVIDAPGAVPPTVREYMDYLWMRGFQIIGESELAASAMKPAGLDSGKALRTYADLTGGRRAAWGRNWQDFYFKSSQQLVALMRRIAKRKPSVDVVYVAPGGRQMERIPWRDVHLDEQSYVLQAFPVSSLPSTPAGRIQQLDEWLNGGVIDPATYRRLLDMPDLEAENDLQGAPRDLLEQIFDQMLYGKGVYVAPEPFFPLALGIQLGTLHLLRGILQGAPRERLDLLRRFLVEAERMQAEMQAPPAPASPPLPEEAPPGGELPPELPPPPMSPV